MVKTLVKSFLRCLGMTVLVFGPGVLLSMASLTAGMIWMLVGSFAMVAWSYRKPWRMSWLMCVVPPIASVLCYVAQLALAKGGPNVGLFTGAGALGLCVGAFSGWTHKVFVRDNRVFARRTAVYLLVWFAAYAFTQAVAVAGRYEIANIGRLGGMFTTAMVLTLAVVLTIKYVRTRRRLAPMQASRPPGRAGNVILPVLLLVGAASAVAQVNYRYGTSVPVESADQAVDRLITGLQIQPGQSKGRNFILEPSEDRRTEARISVQLLADRDRAVRLMQQDMEGSRQTAGSSASRRSRSGQPVLQHTTE
jgi:membrane protein CcdC involved in cytochrome C biogenesis